MNHPQLLARNMVIDINDSNVGKFKTFGIPVKFSKTPGCIMKSSPRLGEDTYRIMEEVGYTKKEIDRMIKEDIVVGYDFMDETGGV